MVQEKTNTAKEVSDKMNDKTDPWMQKVSENSTEEVTVEEATETEDKKD